MRLVSGKVVGFTVDGATRRSIDELGYFVLTAALQQVDQAGDVDISVEGWLDHGFAHTGFGGMVVHHLGLFCGKELVQAGVSEVEPMETSPGIEVALFAGAQVIDNDHVMACGNVGVNNVRANKAGPASNQYLQESPFDGERKRHRPCKSGCNYTLLSV